MEGFSPGSGLTSPLLAECARGGGAVFHTGADTRSLPKQTVIRVSPTRTESSGDFNTDLRGASAGPVCHFWREKLPSTERSM